jgi:hypothetical protein
MQFGFVRKHTSKNEHVKFHLHDRLMKFCYAGTAAVRFGESKNQRLPGRSLQLLVAIQSIKSKCVDYGLALGST